MAISDPPKIETFGSAENLRRHFTWEEGFSFLRTATSFILVVIFLRATIVEAFKIPSGSMIPTLQIWDYILVSKISYGVRLPFVSKTIFRFASPKRGDVVVFTHPDDPATAINESYTNIIKRVVGLPGDTVEVRGTKVYINGTLLNEPYARWEENGMRGGSFGPQKIPEGRVLLLGDNRDHSRDSRFWSDPFLEIDRVKGKALIIYWSWDDLARIGNIIR